MNKSKLLLLVPILGGLLIASFLYLNFKKETPISPVPPFSQEDIYGASVASTSISDTLGTLRRNVNDGLNNLNNAILAGAFGPLSATSTLDVTGKTTLTNASTTGMITIDGGFISSASSTIKGTLVLTGGLNASSTATSTFARGISLDAGCFAIGSTCLPSTDTTGITSLGGLTGVTQTFSSNNLLTITSAGTNHHFNASTSPYFGGITATGTIAFTNLSSGLTANNSGTLYAGIATSSASCSGSVSCSGFTVVGSVSPTITSLASLFAWTPRIDGNATTTRILLDNGFISLASSTISNNLSVSTLSSGLIASGNGLLYGSIATGTVSGTGGVTVTASRSAIGGALAIDCTAAGSGSTGCLSSTDWTTFNNKSGFAYLFPSNATTSSLTIGGILSTASSTFSSNLDLSGGTVKQRLYPKFNYATSSWTGTTTRTFGAFVPETWNSAACKTNTGTVTVIFSDATNKMNAIIASTTRGQVLLTTNNSFTALESQQIDLGSVTGSAKEIDCVIDKTVN